MNPTVAGLLVFILFTLCVPVHAQKRERIDSLKHELTNTHPDTTQVQMLFSISMAYWSFQPDSAMVYAAASLEKAEAIQYTKGRADALLHIGRLKRDRDQVAEALNDMFAALKLYREINDRVQIANSLNDISIIYANSNDYKKSLVYFKQALEIFQQMKDEKGESYALNNMGIIYQELGDEATAKDYFIRSLKIKEKRKDLYGISRGYNNLGSIAENNKQWAEALMYYFKADSLFEKTDDTQAQAGNFFAIARVKDKQGKAAEAGKYAAIALEKGKEVKALSSMLDAAKLLATLDERKNNYKGSLAYQKLYNELSDSLNNENHKANLEELKAKFNVEEKEREIALLIKDKELQAARLDRKNIITYSLVAGIVLMVFILGSLYYAYRATRSKRDSLAQKNREIEQQKDALDKLNKEKDRFFSILSHDLRGPLSSLKGFSYLITEHLDTLTTEDLAQMRLKIDSSLDNLTELINNILEWSMTSSRKRQWSFDKISTTELIRKNISLYQGIADSKGVTLIHQPHTEQFAYGDYYAVDTVIRNLLSNSIKFSHPKKDVIISVATSPGTVMISVKDHGIGIPLDIQGKLFTLNENVTQPGTNNEKGTGLGLTLCMELIKENKGDILVNSKPGEGSEFILYIPEYSSRVEAVISPERAVEEKIRVR